MDRQTNREANRRTDRQGERPTDRRLTPLSVFMQNHSGGYIVSLSTVPLSQPPGISFGVEQVKQQTDKPKGRRTHGQMDGDFTNSARAYERKRGGTGEEEGEPDHTGKKSVSIDLNSGFSRSVS